MLLSFHSGPPLYRSPRNSVYSQKHSDWWLDLKPCYPMSFQRRTYGSAFTEGLRMLFFYRRSNAFIHSSFRTSSWPRVKMVHKLRVCKHFHVFLLGVGKIQYPPPPIFSHAAVSVFFLNHHCLPALTSASSKIPFIILFSVIVEFEKRKLFI
jgi:hypothetical protein